MGATGQGPLLSLCIHPVATGSVPGAILGLGVWACPKSVHLSISLREKGSGGVAACALTLFYRESCYHLEAQGELSFRCCIRTDRVCRAPGLQGHWGVGGPRVVAWLVGCLGFVLFF